MTLLPCDSFHRRSCANEPCNLVRQQLCYYTLLWPKRESKARAERRDVKGWSVRLGQRVNWKTCNLCLLPWWTEMWQNVHGKECLHLKCLRQESTSDCIRPPEPDIHNSSRSSCGCKVEFTWTSVVELVPDEGGHNGCYPFVPPTCPSFHRELSFLTPEAANRRYPWIFASLPALSTGYGSAHFSVIWWLCFCSCND